MLTSWKLQRSWYLLCPSKDYQDFWSEPLKLGTTSIFMLLNVLLWKTCEYPAFPLDHKDKWHFSALDHWTTIADSDGDGCVDWHAHPEPEFRCVWCWTLLASLQKLSQSSRGQITVPVHENGLISLMDHYRNNICNWLITWIRCYVWTHLVSKEKDSDLSFLSLLINVQAKNGGLLLNILCWFLLCSFCTVQW